MLPEVDEHSSSTEAEISSVFLESVLNLSFSTDSYFLMVENKDGRSYAGKGNLLQVFEMGLLSPSAKDYYLKISLDAHNHESVPYIPFIPLYETAESEATDSPSHLQLTDIHSLVHVSPHDQRELGKKMNEEFDHCSSGRGMTILRPNYT
jgi:hypothetical protein